MLERILNWLLALLICLFTRRRGASLAFMVKVGQRFELLPGGNQVSAIFKDDGPARTFKLVARDAKGNVTTDGITDVSWTPEDATIAAVAPSADNSTAAIGPTPEGKVGDTVVRVKAKLNGVDAEGVLAVQVVPDVATAISIEEAATS